MGRLTHTALRLILVSGLTVACGSEDPKVAEATTVYVTGIEEFQGRELAAILVVQLPAAEAPRRMLFEWEGAFAKTTDSEPSRDVGQRYLKIILD